MWNFISKALWPIGSAKQPAPVHKGPVCDDCGAIKFYGGPGGCGSENIMCMQCGSAFNYFGGPVVLMDRISNRWWTHDEDPDKRAKLLDGIPAPRKDDKGMAHA